MIKNPILPGFYPDPSICRVQDDFYIVTSSFSYFPGIPVFHSKDLVNWQQIGHVLDREEQLHVTYEDNSFGIFAPTIRYDKGVFYVITTNMTTHENFICTATQPEGPWSNPIVIKSAGGIDPSLFFDEDGKVYYTGTTGFGDKRYDHQAIVCSEIDMSTFQLVGNEWVIGDGAAKNAHSPEGPHLYKKNGWYYLLIAEGGTEHFHAITISRSRSLKEPFENFQGNPILTHRHLGFNYPICNVGHGDMVELLDGSWYMVCLGSRLINGYHKPLGRETFLVPVLWEEDWPVISPGTGKIEWEYPAPDLPEYPYKKKEETDYFTGNTLGLEWNYLGTPYEHFATVQDDKLHIRMLAKNTIPSEFEGELYDFFGHMKKLGQTKENVPFLGKRMKQHCFIAETKMEVDLAGKESSGMILLQNNANQIRFECRSEDESNLRVSVTSVHYQLVDKKMHYEEREEGSILIEKEPYFTLRITGNKNAYRFEITSPKTTCLVAENIDGRHLGSESAGGFVGTYIGLFATGNGVQSENYAAFHWFTLKE